MAQSTVKARKGKGGYKKDKANINQLNILDLYEWNNKTNLGIRDGGKYQNRIFQRPKRGILEMTYN